MSALLRRSLIGVGLGVVIYAIAIIWFDAERGPVRGRAAPKVIRQGARAEAPT